MTGQFNVKLKSKDGQFIVKDLTPDTSIAVLKQRIFELTQISVSKLQLLMGFPPRPIDISQDDNSLQSQGINNGETLIVQERAQAVQPSLEDDEALARRLQAEEDEEQLRQAVAAENNSTIVQVQPQPELQQPQQPQQQQQPQQPTVSHTTQYPSNPMSSAANDNFNGILLKKVVPADNSCLFTSVRFVLNGKVDNEGSEMMRHIIATEVAADPEQYNDAVLGKTNAEYCSWIQKPDSWGGAIEVAILSNYYGIEIDVVDIQNAIINRFGEDKNYGLRVFLLFDGIHYDPLYMETPTGGTPATIFPVEEINVYHQAEQLANEAKSSRQFTNVDKFTLRCMQCNVELIGQTQAQQHYKNTGHSNFGEI